MGNGHLPAPPVPDRVIGVSIFVGTESRAVAQACCMHWPFTSYPLASGDYELRTSFQNVPAGTF